MVHTSNGSAEAAWVVLGKDKKISTVVAFQKSDRWKATTVCGGILGRLLCFCTLSVFGIFASATIPSFITAGFHFKASNKPMSTKKSMNRKEVVAFTEAELSAGKSKQSIFEELSEKYFDSKTLAGYIASVPNPELREQYAPLNTLLVLLLVVSGVIKLFIILLLLSERSIGVMLIGLLVPTLNFVIAWSIWKMRGSMYRVLFVFALVGMGRTMRTAVDDDWWFLIDIVFVLLIAGLSLYLQKKLFPNVGWRGVQKDAAGNYQF